MMQKSVSIGFCMCDIRDDGDDDGGDSIRGDDDDVSQENDRLKMVVMMMLMPVRMALVTTALWCQGFHEGLKRLMGGRFNLSIYDFVNLP